MLTLCTQIWYKIIKMTLGSLLRHKRESLGMTVREVGKDAGISYSLVSKFEKGSRMPTPVILQKMQDVLGMNDREFQELIQIRNQSETASIDRKGGGIIQWKVIEAVKEFKSIYPIM